MPTVGIEIEIPKVGQEFLSYIQELNLNAEYSVHDDGSIRGPCYTVDGIPFVGLRSRSVSIENYIREARPIGLELVSNPVHIEPAIYDAKKLAKALRRVPPTGNASIHIHMDIAGLPYKTINNMVAWFYLLEAIMYRVSALGIRHRGEHTDYMYMRPLSAPINWVIGGDDDDNDSNDDDDEESESGQQSASIGSVEPILNINRVIAAPNASQFAFEWGRLDRYWGEGNRYIPHRLHGLNVVPVQRQGTIELRIFNGVYRYLPECIMLARDWYNLALTRSYKEAPPELFYPLGFDGVVSEDVWNFIGFSSDVRKVFDRSEWPKPPINRRLVHHYDRRIWMRHDQFTRPIELFNGSVADRGNNQTREQYQIYQARRGDNT